MANVNYKYQISPSAAAYVRGNSANINYVARTLDVQQDAIAASIAREITNTDLAYS
jgi:hypothetical protein